MGENILRLHSGGCCMELPLEQMIKVLPSPQLIRLPGAPQEIAGLVYTDQSLIAVRYIEGAAPMQTYACVVLTAGADGSLYGLAADEITGGGQDDTIYGS